MFQAIKPGVYLIANIHTSKVLHANQDVLGRSGIKLAGRSEHKKPDSQIWLIEGLPFMERTFQYTITNVRTGKLLEAYYKVKYGETIDSGVKLEKCSGNELQRWIIERRMDTASNGLDEYCITNIADDSRKVLESVISSANPEAKLETEDMTTRNPKQRWEFVIPFMGIPVGWVFIINRSTGQFISQEYISQQPACKAPPSSKFQSQYRETWGAQWSLVSETKYEGGTGWIIKNRLTNGELEHPNNRMYPVSAEIHGSSDIESAQWLLELDVDGNFLIRNAASRLYLQNTLRSGKHVLGCDKRMSNEKSSHHWWTVVPVHEYIRNEWPAIDTESTLASEAKEENDTAEETSEKASEDGVATPASSSEGTVVTTGD